ncbi:MAG: hypothetical protein AAGF12_26015 [Myxococcota bacterium]
MHMEFVRRSLPLAVLAALFAACTSDSGGAGTLRVELNGEEASREGFPVGEGEDQIAFADGYTVQFDRVLVSFASFELRGADGEVASLSADPIVVDLHTGTPEAWVFEDVPARRWEDVRYTYAAPTAETRAVGAIAQADIDAMIQNGYAMLVSGTAMSSDAQAYPFELGFEFVVDNTRCVSGTDETDGLVIPNGAVVDSELTIHFDHLWFDTYAFDDAELRFEAWAAVAPANGPITLDTLAQQSLSDLRDRQGMPIERDGTPLVYNPGPLNLAANNLREYTVAAATTTGHFNGEGHCDYTLRQ